MELDLNGYSSVIYNAMKPDENFKLKGLKLSSHVKGKNILINLICSRGPRSVLVTIDEIFSMISMIYKFKNLNSLGWSSD